jgi:protein-tyrosine-phosphatase
MSAERGLALTFASAGTGAAMGAPATDGAILVGMERGLDLSRHRSRPLLPDAVEGGTIVLTMSRSHISNVRATAPDARVFLLDEYGSHGRTARSVADPFGGDLDDYRHAADQIEEMLPAVLDRLMVEQGGQTA